MGESIAKERTNLQREATIEIESRTNDSNSLAPDKDDPSKPRNNNQGPTPIVGKALGNQKRRGGGPRTARGKQASSRNSRVHGIFAKAMLLADESADQFNLLLQGYRDYFRPEGTPEDVLVEELATLKWRQRRLLNAEKAEIQSGRTFNPRTAEREREDRTEFVMSELSATAEKFGLLESARNPRILDRIFELLKSFEFSIRKRGFDPDEDRPMLVKIFGEERLCDLRLEYEACYDPTSLSGSPVFKDYDLPVEQRIAKFVDCIENERSHLIREENRLAKLSEQKEKIEIESSWVPEAPRLERLLRYAASIERSFERALNQLERLQRYRLGQPVFPPLNVQLST
jgi:hypothetical protein